MPQPTSNNLSLIIALVIMLFSTALTAQERVMTDEQWRTDLAQMSTAIKDIHFKPFAEVSEADFDTAVVELSDAIPEMSDKAIIASMAKIVASIHDGHTRLHLPRQFPELALEAEIGHSGTAPPYFDELKFQQLPVSFELFEDGLFITGATTAFTHSIGREVVAVGDVSADKAIDLAKTTSFHENDNRANLIAPNRLALPEVLQALGIIKPDEQVSILTRDKNSIEERITLPSMSTGSGPLSSGANQSVLWLKNRDQHEWYEVLPSQDAIYVQVNQFAESPPRPYGSFVAETLAAAREAEVSRFIIDLRHNTGGIGAWTTPFLTGLSRSEFNEYGRLYVLIGKTTFSAAQHFLHEFEEFTYAIFVGEPSGAKPSHFSDPKRVILENSGLTLRVSTLYWHSWLANDFREASNPHIDAPLTSQDFFTGKDPALQAALTYNAPSSLALQMGEQLRKGKIQNGLLLLNRYITDGTIANHQQAVPELLQLGHDLLDDEVTRPGFFVLFLTNNYFPGNADVLTGLGRAHELMDSPEEALEAYNDALEIDPENKEALAGLSRIPVTD